jgi:hypothetical protein
MSTSPLFKCAVAMLENDARVAEGFDAQTRLKDAGVGAAAAAE